MATIHIDGEPHETRDGENLLQAVLEAGVDLPYFCWHPELGSVGACRQCAVKQFNGPDDKRGRIVMACMTPATEGAIISVSDPEAKEFRGEVVEWLMTNHPHDCPVCEEGGECHLQDMTVMTGHRARRYRFEKRTHRNQDLGPFVKHEMNRCISCYRCVRFYRDYAGGQDLAAFASHNNMYFGRAESGTLESPFAGNLIEVCPTGVFTDKQFSKTYSRKWDMRGAPSVCAHCSVGCNTIVNERAGTVRRTINRYNDEVNRYFLCDRGRYGHGYANADTRIRVVGQLIDGVHHQVPSQAAISHFATFAEDGPVIGIGSARASLETNYALRSLVGAAQFSTGLAEPAHGLTLLAADILRTTPAHTPSLHDVEQCDAVFMLGEDALSTAPRLGLSMRQATRHASFLNADRNRIPRWMDASVRMMGQDFISPLMIATPAATGLDDCAVLTQHAAPDDLARLGFAVAHLIDEAAPAVPGLTEAESTVAGRIAEALLAADKPLVVSGTQLGSAALMQAAASIAAALMVRGKPAALSLVLPDANSMGVALMGGLSLDAVCDMARDGKVGTLIVAEADLTRQLAPERVEALLGQVRHFVLIDHSESPLIERAELVLPAAPITHSGGTMVNMEGRAQRFLPVAFPEGPVEVSWRWLRDFAESIGQDDRMAWQTLDDVVAAIARELTVFARIGEAAPSEQYMLESGHIRSQTARVSGRTAIRSHISVRDQPVPPMPDSPLSPTMEGTYSTSMPGALVPYYHAPGWNSEQSLNRFQQEIGGPMRGGYPGVRLVDAAEAVWSSAHYSTDLPETFAPRDGSILLLPESRIFGSEELSALAPAIAERAEPAVVRMAGDGPSEVTLTLDGIRHRLPVLRDDSLPPGLAFYPAHMTLRAFAAPVWVSLETAEALA
ncbi:NADH-quinone oxidoreductase subunit NuoG [Tanticharoenia sakaeratensis]|uniref:NADH-quinone oxidoreductase n=1 Tax=Tanticharoenia sakaeratensis NBRC 103193 TaxID=1231623 RepID=A0A0D6MJ71_9PROT|nr:NADH-quinone oxidoreductase subunit NuoG [Tanticharoenia sakaeratensis]GAN53536.1 NADH-quinone oxidoreductase subunit 3 [Tanticharoenia sakaeratensis NBRC 103193]GBQ17622.1 NADH-quinone oxidoreductase subunit G [Tanticharoenia sakaeratensis NBRC 103193]